MPPLGFELTISAGERPQTYALDRAAGHRDRRFYSFNRLKTLFASFPRYNSIFKLHIYPKDGTVYGADLTPMRVRKTKDRQPVSKLTYTHSLKKTVVSIFLLFISEEVRSYVYRRTIGYLVEVRHFHK